MLVLPGPHGGCHCIGQKVHMYIFPVQGSGGSKTLVGLQHFIVLGLAHNDEKPYAVVFLEDLGNLLT